MTYYNPIFSLVSVLRAGGPGGYRRPDCPRPAAGGVRAPAQRRPAPARHRADLSSDADQPGRAAGPGGSRRPKAPSAASSTASRSAARPARATACRSIWRAFLARVRSHRRPAAGGGLRRLAPRAHRRMAHGGGRGGRQRAAQRGGRRPGKRAHPGGRGLPARASGGGSKIVSVCG